MGYVSDEKNWIILIKKKVKFIIKEDILEILPTDSKWRQINLAVIFLTMREVAEDSPAKSVNSEGQELKVKVQSWGSLWSLQHPQEAYPGSRWIYYWYIKSEDSHANQNWGVNWLASAIMISKEWQFYPSWSTAATKPWRVKKKPAWLWWPPFE